MTTPKRTRFLSILVLSILFGGCTVFVGMHLDRDYGPSSAANRLTPTPGAHTVSYWQDVKPILEARCILCHGCYDAPCQLDLSAYEGIERGANKDLVYNPARLLAAEPTRLFVDADSTEQWRKAEFFPVLNERSQTRDTNLGAGLMVKMLQLKRQHPQPKVSPLPESFDFSLDRKQSCPTVEEFDHFAEKQPLWGMPYGIPDLSDREYGTLLTWLEEGAIAEAPPPLASGVMAQVSAWETFFNHDTPKEQLMSRYLYEHLFIADLYFGDGSTRSFFRLVRSKTPPGKPIEFIATRRPYDDPTVPRPYYRLQPVRTSILDKTHMPYRLDDARMARYRALFLDPDYAVPELPSYDPKTSANPFATFHAIPARSRYEFLLDEAQFTLMNFIKGPVCRGQVALNVINERFWVILRTNGDGFIFELICAHCDLRRTNGDGFIFELICAHCDLKALPQPLSSPKAVRHSRGVRIRMPWYVLSGSKWRLSPVTRKSA